MSDNNHDEAAEPGREPVTHSLKGSVDIDLSKITKEEDEDDG